MANRIVSAGFWLGLQDLLMKASIVVGILGLVGGLLIGFQTGSSDAAMNGMWGGVCAMVLLILLARLTEPLRIDGIPFLER